MDSSSQFTMAYDKLYYVKFTVISIKTIFQTSIYYSFADISSLVRHAILNL